MDAGLKLESFHRIINGLSDEQLDQFYSIIDKYFIVENVDLGLTGNFDLDEIIQLIESRNQVKTTFGLIDVRNNKFLTFSIDESSIVDFIT